MYKGSSPLTRGKRTASLPHPGGAGLIPAHAGKTRRPGYSIHSTTAHPRSRGENAIASALATFVAGSSPLTRGKHWGVDGQSHDGGLIPAHAGKTG